MFPRPPIVTILGHVDHGKTTLLDYIRKSKVAAMEHGGITQKIGAYEISTGIKGYPTDKITFIDTPGHEAFSKLRSRGANVADVALLVVDAQDSLKPQTVESISHIKSAGIPFIVVANKIDLPGANVEKLKIDLMKNDVMVEDKGGKVPLVSISAKSGQGVNELLEAILLLTSDLNLQYDENAKPQAYIIETKKDRRGVVTSAIIKNGKLKVSDTIYADQKQAKVRALINDLGTQVKEVAPSTPFELLGFQEIPEVGVLISAEKKQIEAEQKEVAQKTFGLDDIFVKEKEKKLNLIIKAESHGSLEAIVNSLSEKENIEIVLKGIGEIHKSDIFLAKTTKSIVIGFNVKPTSDVHELAKQEKVIVKIYSLIYDLLEELTEVALILKEKEEAEKDLKGEAKVLANFIIGNEKIFGIKITKGKVNLGDKIKLLRDGDAIGEGQLVSLRFRAKTIKEAKKDQEAGVIIEPHLDIKIGDVLKFIL